jgi:hypothetical protein
MASVELINELFQAIEKHKTEAKTLAGVIQSLWRLDMLNTEKCEVIPSLEYTQYAVQQISYSNIILLHSDHLPEATNIEDAEPVEIIDWLYDHWQSGTVAILIP